MADGSPSLWWLVTSCQPEGGYSPPIPGLSAKSQLIVQVAFAGGYLYNELTRRRGEISESGRVVFVTRTADGQEEAIPVSFRDLVTRDGWSGGREAIAARADRLTGDFDQCALAANRRSRHVLMVALELTQTCMERLGYSTDERNLATVVAASAGNRIRRIEI